MIRETGPWTPAVHALLRHLEQVGFAAAPRLVGPGLDAAGREVLTFIHGRDLGGQDTVIGHCDVAPWNIVARGGLPVALIDWETAGPVDDPLVELAQLGWLNARLHDTVARIEHLPPRGRPGPPAGRCPGATHGMSRTRWPGSSARWATSRSVAVWPPGFRQDAVMAWRIAHLLVKRWVK